MRRCFCIPGPQDFLAPLVFADDSNGVPRTSGSSADGNNDVRSPFRFDSEPITANLSDQELATCKGPKLWTLVKVSLFTKTI
jgi:hypothetical protein